MPNNQKLGVYELEMADLPELGGSSGFVKASDIDPQEGMIVTILSEPVIVDSNFKDKETGEFQKRCRVTLKVGSLEKLWTMNNTTYRLLKDKFGKKPAGWVKKKVQIRVVNTLVQGKMTDVLYGEPR